jgi:hypothetical protein
MADTPGSLMDKLSIVNLKMWWNQEILYKIRRMTKEEFADEYSDDIDEVRRIVGICCDMNVLRTQLVDEINDRLAMIGEAAGISQAMLNKLRLVAPSHKTY